MGIVLCSVLKITGLGNEEPKKMTPQTAISKLNWRWARSKAGKSIEIYHVLDVELKQITFRLSLRL